MALSQKLKNEKMFNNASWRDFTTSICKTIDKNNIGFQIISPFGFEVFEDRFFLTRSLKRLYCYIGIPISHSQFIEPSKISDLFTSSMLEKIHESEISKSDIAIMVSQDNFIFCHDKNYQCGQSDKLIDVQTRFVKTNILDDYANYIICTLDSINSGKDEPKYYYENKRHRSRTIQLYVMLEKLFKPFIEQMTTFQIKMFNDVFKFIDNSIQMFYTPSRLSIDASTQEMKTLEHLIKPRIELMISRILTPTNQYDDVINIMSDAYHVSGKLEINISRDIYNLVKQRIHSTYTNFI